jgi:hypothetical protein
MGYYTRVLATLEDCNSIALLSDALEEAGSGASLEITEGTEVDWGMLLLRHENGAEIAGIERNLVSEGSLAEDELREFTEELDSAKPASAARWLRSYLPRVRCVYTFQHLSGTRLKGGFEALTTIRNSIWSRGSAIFQADGEGFSNEEGYHILWQFAEPVEGKWWVAVLQEGAWTSFQMELSNQDHREAFWRGKVPADFA